MTDSVSSYRLKNSVINKMFNLSVGTERMAVTYRVRGILGPDLEPKPEDIPGAKIANANMSPEMWEEFNASRQPEQLGTAFLTAFAMINLFTKEVQKPDLREI